MPANLVFHAADLIRFLPEIILTVMGTLLMVLDPLLHKRSSYALRPPQHRWRWLAGDRRRGLRVYAMPARRSAAC